jgi:DNA-binding NtrC family response regulator
LPFNLSALELSRSTACESNSRVDHNVGHLVVEYELRDRHRFENMIGKSPAMQNMFQLLETLADVDTTVLITGENGTGKELVSRALHYGGVRAGKPMVSVN